jgi:ferritin-like metal-binding protein YciE
MAIQGLKDVYIDQCQDLYSACKQSHEVTVALHGAAKNSDLRDALKAGADGIEEGMAKVAEIVRAHGADPEGEHCRGMEGLVKEARAHALEEEFGDDDARDAMIIAQYQRMAHYAIAGWGCLEAYAKRLGLKDDARTLGENLGATQHGDQTMNRIAEGQVNQAAMA